MKICRSRRNDSAACCKEVVVVAPLRNGSLMLLLVVLCLSSSNVSSNLFPFSEEEAPAAESDLGRACKWRAWKKNGILLLEPVLFPRSSWNKWNDHQHACRHDGQADNRNHHIGNGKQNWKENDKQRRGSHCGRVLLANRGRTCLTRSEWLSK